MDLNELRGEIDHIDDEMLQLFLKRMQISGEIADYKKEHDLPIMNRQREREILAEAGRKSGSLELYGHRFFAGLMELSRAYQAQRMHRPTELIQGIQDSRLDGSAVFPKTGDVAVSGVEGAYGQEAADRLFPRGTILYKRSFEAVFDAVESGEVPYGIVPVENSSFGSVRGVYHLLQERDVTITRSTRVNVQHELLANPGTRLKDIREIYSHEQALGQCEKFIKSLGNGVKIIPVTNTALAAKMVSESDRSDVAAIASHDAGQLYGLKTLKSSIMDSDNNYTRFIVIRSHPAVYPGATRISLILSTEHRSGALYDVLAMITALNINMLKLESFPMVGTDFEFAFFMDLEASVWDPAVLGLLDYLERTTDFFKYLGNYPEL